MNAALFLTPDELVELTGYSMPRSQRKWLDANGYLYAVNANNQPKVARDYLLSRLGVVVAGARNADPVATPRPNFAALKPAA